METRSLPIGFELKAVQGRTIEGYAAAWARDRVNDIIDTRAFDRTIKANPDVAIFVGHDSTKLPVGYPIEMRADSHGLFTKSHIYDTPDGNALLTVATERLARGRTLGMSIGFRTVKDHWDSKQKARILEDVDLIEYSFLASPALAANPQAVALGVKATSLLEESYEDLQGDLRDAATAALGGSYCCVVATFPDHVIVMAMEPGDSDGEYYDFPYTLGPDMEPTLGEPKPVQQAFVDDATQDRGKAALAVFREKAAPKKASAESAVVKTKGAPRMDLDDTAFAFIESGGTFDEERKTVPRAKRHLGHHLEDGSIDVESLKSILSDPDALFAYGDLPAAHILRHAQAASVWGRPIPHDDAHEAQWTKGTAPMLLAREYKTGLLTELAAANYLAHEELGHDTKGGLRISRKLHHQIVDEQESWNTMVARLSEIEQGIDGTAVVETWRTTFQLLDLEEVA